VTASAGHTAQRLRPWLLHARARGLPAALLGWSALAAVVAVLHLTPEPVRAALAVVAAAFAAVLAAGCLAGHDELEESTPRTGRRWRLLHGLALGALAVALPALGWLVAADAVQRPARLALLTVGLYGVALAGTVLLGAARAWTFVVGHLVAGLVLAPTQAQAAPARWLLTAVTWPTLPLGTPVVLAAGATAAVGLLALTTRRVRG
jgi:hypothetical protein